MAHPRTPCKRHRRLQRSRHDHVRLRCAVTALLWRSRRSHCAATAILRCSHCAHVRTPSHGAYFEHAQSARRGMETKESSRRPTEMPRSCFCALGDLTARIMAFCIFSGGRADSVRTQLWCDRHFITLAPGSVIFLSTLVPGSGRFQLTNLVGYS